VAAHQVCLSASEGGVWWDLSVEDVLGLVKRSRSGGGGRGPGGCWGASTSVDMTQRSRQGTSVGLATASHARRNACLRFAALGRRLLS
jgi:hypothetical protein